jgi:hypothetical protein
VIINSDYFALFDPYFLAQYIVHVLPYGFPNLSLMWPTEPKEFHTPVLEALRQACQTPMAARATKSVSLAKIL